MTTWTDLRQRLRALLSDPNGVLFSDALLEEAARRALAALDAAGGGLGWTLAGLNGAVETSLPAPEQEICLAGAGAAAVTLRALARAERFDLNESIGGELAGWAERQQAQFDAALERVRSRCLQSATLPPYGSAGWPLDGPANCPEEI